MRIAPITIVVHVRNDANTDSDSRLVQKKHAEDSGRSVVVTLSTEKSRAEQESINNAVYHFK